MAKYLPSKLFWSIIGYLIKLDWADLSNVIKLTNSWFNLNKILVTVKDIKIFVTEGDVNIL